MKLFNKILVANRGEIALRIIRSAKKLAIRTVAIYAASEQDADYVKLADEAVSLGSDELGLTFLNIDKIIQIAISSGSEAIHPGYGFLSENPGFALACEENHLVFIGPRSGVLRLMGNKPAAKSLAQSLDIPVLLSQKIDFESNRVIKNHLNYPVLIKASFGGGGKAMELVFDSVELETQIEKSSRMALNYFGNGELFIEQYIKNARHVEVQIIGDNYCNIIHLYERDCSIQRNHQKIIEEAPAKWLNTELRDKILTAALKIGNAVNYSGAGTIEFLVDEAGNFFFMEMNPRIQVEHAVTEAITGIDIVNEQLLVASGYPLSYSQDQIKVNGHAIELRIYAEDPSHNFAPSALPVLSVNLPTHKDLRIETNLNLNQQIKNQFDPLLLKLIANAKDRESAIKLLREETKNLNIIGPETNTKYLQAILAHREYRHDTTTVEFCRGNHQSLVDHYTLHPVSEDLPFLIALSIDKVYPLNENNAASNPWDYLGYWRLTQPALQLTVDDQSYNVDFNINNRANPSFMLNGSEKCFSIVNKMENLIGININNSIKQLSYITDIQNNTYISCENKQYRISFPGLLKCYPETGIRKEENLNFDNGEIKAPLHGKILEINVKKNQIIKKGDLLVVIESMKSENRILSPQDAKVKEIAVNVGAQVTDQTPLLFLEELL